MTSPLRFEQLQKKWRMFGGGMKDNEHGLDGLIGFGGLYSVICYSIRIHLRVQKEVICFEHNV
jgi:hypothetical protein